MAKADRIKEELSWLRVVFALCIALDASLFAWLAQNYDNAKLQLLIVGITVVFILTAAIIYINRLAYKRLDELEKF